MKNTINCVFLVACLFAASCTAPLPLSRAMQQSQPARAEVPDPIPDPVVLAATVASNAKHMLADFEQGELSQWEIATSHPNTAASTTYEIAPIASGGRALHAVLPLFTEWDNISKAFNQPFPDNQTLTCFRAKGRPETRQLVLEWQEKDGSRWIAKVDLTTEWKEYALPPQAFRPWLPPAGRGGPGDRLRVENAVRFQVGLAVSHASITPGFQEFWFDDLATAPPIPEVVTLKGLVASIGDPEVLVVSGVGNVRLMGVSALSDLTRKPQPNDDILGQDAERALRRLAAGHRVRLEIEGTRNTPSGGPTLAWVFLEDGSLLNEQLIRRGYARVGPLPSSARYAARLKAAEQDARSARRGLWPKQR